MCIIGIENLGNDIVEHEWISKSKFADKEIYIAFPKFEDNKLLYNWSVIGTLLLCDVLHYLKFVLQCP